MTTMAGWKEWTCSKWRDKVDIAGEMEDEGEITSTGNFGTYRRMCGFGGGECRSENCTLHEKCKYNMSDLIKHK